MTVIYKVMNGSYSLCILKDLLALIEEVPLAYCVRFNYFNLRLISSDTFLHHFGKVLLAAALFNSLFISHNNNMYIWVSIVCGYVCA